MAQKVGAIYYDVTLDTSKLIDGTRDVDRAIDGTALKFNALAVAVKLLAVAYATLKSAQLADDMRLLSARVEVAAGSIDKGADAMRQLEAISRRTQTAIADNAAVFNRLNQSMIQMGGTQGDTLKLVELLGKAVKVSGASAVEASAAMLQFGQALGSGKLAGDELRSLMESAPYLMRQLADGIGVPVGALKKLGEEGKLTSDVVVNALSKAATQIDADFAKFPQTIGAAMTVATDAALKANEKLDELTGTSAALTGVTQGLGRVLDKLALQFGAANTEAGKMGRNDAIASWAQKTQTAFSYVVDAVDVAWQALSVFGRNVNFVFTAIGTEIGGIGAQIAAVMRGDFAGAKAIGDAMTADAQQRRAELDKQDAETLSKRKTWGAQMRDAWNDGSKPPSSNSGFGRLKPPLSGGDDGKAKKQPFDATKYLAGLGAKAADEWAKVAIVEAEALRQNNELLKKKDITQKQHEEAKTLIIADANKQREELMAKDTETYLKEMSDRYQKEQNARRVAMEYMANLTRAVNPIDALRQEYEGKLSLVTQYEQLMAKAGVDATLTGQATRTQITAEYEAQRRGLAEQSFRSQGDAQAFLIDSLNALNQTATTSIMGLLDGTMTATDAMRGLATVVLNEAVSSLVQIGIQQIKNALLSDTLAAADKARGAANGAVYAASVSAQVVGMSSMAAMNAFAATAAIPIIGPALAPAAAASAAAIAGALGAPAIATAPLAGARQYGGPVSSGSLYRVNEQGRPEMFTAANGSQYMMPTTSGRVTSADNVGGGVQWSIVVNNTAPGATATASVDQNSRTISIAVSEVANQIRTNTGPVWSALKSSTTTGSRLS